ncbi:MAG: short-chain dehydrogenase [Gammaproteobacteria bacterium CG_4_10_14_0_8_um_filter_38_16]|nr:MAG: short-chain dehydrogenase [Gammaproteobacteria bacterium CG_4_10_14_0_8_um_filter_38_16]PJA04093.1 MAG: short-chain dehydrogenase [Gammaproteobacteria bacterium CG_4_10_14_0_2_um_filter_38_22]PJB10041.1 MAG: short-chain dehydrogenase [Gammaproteobacteria bacterium CG_4_9_14_3_um_filter_38_9]
MAGYKKLFELDNKVAVVTGAGGILGAEFCNALGALGAKVACLDSNLESLKQLELAIKKNQDVNNFIFLRCDVSSVESVQQSVAAIIQRFSRIDILLNNAATKSKEVSAFFTPFFDYSLSLWREIMSVNLDGMFLMAQAVGKHMLAKKQGTIIQTASLYSLLAPDQRIYEGSQYLGGEINTPAVYTTSKAGVVGLTKHLAALWGASGIRVNALCPGGVSSGQNNVFSEKYAARVPMGRMAEKIDIIGPMLFLASDASQYMTGQVLYVDGGVSVW